MSLPKQLPDWCDLNVAYRFLSNEDIDPQAILAPHKALVRNKAAELPVVLAVQDDSSLDFTGRPGTSGLGIIGDGRGQGLLQHATWAVRPDKQVLGVLDLSWHAVAPVLKGETLRQAQNRWNISDVWPDAALAIGAWPENSQLIHVGDRHADLFRFMHQAKLLRHEFVVRAMHDRYVDDDTRRLWDKVMAREILGQMTVSLGTQRVAGKIKRVGREALLSIRVVPILVPPSCNDPRNHGAKPLNLWAVYALEEHPPAGIDAVEWMLVTSLEALTLAQALVILGYYTCRWVIEEWHRCLKEGCRLEASQLDEAADIQRLAAVLSVVAVRLLELRDLAGSAQGQSPEALRARVPTMYIVVVAALAKVAAEQLTAEVFWRTVAKRGGWLGRKHDPRPGWIVLWRAWTDIVQMVRGAELFQQISKRGERCV